MKYTFKEFIAATESKDFDVISPESWQEAYAERFLRGIDEPQIHNGDCTKQPCPCYLCTLQRYLEDYKQYTFHEEEYRKENCL